MIINGQLRDVTDKVSRAFGLYRVEPLNGFEIGKRYRIRFEQLNNDKVSVWQVGNPDPKSLFTQSLTITIDRDAAIVKRSSELGLVADGVPQKQKSGWCEPRYESGQNVSFKMPFTWLQYQSSLLYFAGKGEPSTKQSSIGFSKLPLGRLISLRSSESYSASWEAFIKSNYNGHPDVYVSGYLGFLEVEDNLRLLPTIKLPVLDQPKAPAPIQPIASNQQGLAQNTYLQLLRLLLLIAMVFALSIFWVRHHRRNQSGRSEKRSVFRHLR